MITREKPDAVKMFLRGDCLDDVAVFFGTTNDDAEQVLREAITQLVNLNAQLATRINAAAVDEEARIVCPN